MKTCFCVNRLVIQFKQNSFELGYNAIRLRNTSYITSNILRYQFFLQCYYNTILLSWNDTRLQGHKFMTLKNELNSIQNTFYTITHAIIRLKNLVERNRLEELSVDEWIRLKLILKKSVRMA